MSDVQIYGQFRGWWSNTGVSRGLACGLAANGLKVSVLDIDETDIQTESLLYEGLWNRDVLIGRDEAAPVGIFVGYPPRSPGWLRLHPHKVGAFITESAVLPVSWMVAAATCDLIVTPSRWVSSVYRQVTIEEKVLVVPHGLDPTYAELPPPRDLRFPLQFLHISGARDFLSRKGTPQLIEAFAAVFGLRGSHADAAAHLTIRTPPGPAIYSLVGRDSHLYTVDSSEEALRPSAMRAYYGRSWAALVQPSRSEAFGLCCTEARSQGVPVLCTRCTGHAEHAEIWDVPVEHKPSSTIAVNGIPNGLAPSVRVADIADALRLFLEYRVEITAEAARRCAGYYGRYDWKALTASLARRLKADLG